MNDSDLDDLFGVARQQRVAVSAALMARVLADAEVLQPVAAGLPVVARRPGFLGGLWAAIGGIGGLAGLSTAALAGVWIGFAQPSGLNTVTELFFATDTGWSTDMGAETLNVLPGLDDFLSEG